MIIFFCQIKIAFNTTLMKIACYNRAELLVQATLANSKHFSQSNSLKLNIFNH